MAMEEEAALSGAGAARARVEGAAASSRQGPTGEAIAHWLLDGGIRLETSALMDGVGWRLRAAGLPLDRLTCSVQLLSANTLAASVVWQPWQPLRFRRLDYANRDRGFYERSPLKAAHDRGEWLDLDLHALPDDAYDILPELKAAGLRHYVAIPIAFSDGARNTITMATKAAEGFSARDRAIVAAMLPAFRAVLEIKTQERTLREVLATYVGTGPAQEIVSGTTHRGEITKLNAAIYVADLRGFTWLSTQMPPEATADVLNAYYDIVVPPVREAGGEVLKFIGDAVLAIFPERAGEPSECCQAALAAAEAGLADGEAHFTVAGVAHPVRFGIALHVGEVAYGNVGSGDRLDFTVVGRDVNVAARISALCSTLGRPFLVSRRFVENLGAEDRPFRSLGSHPVRGLAEPLEVLAPRDKDTAAPDAVSVGPTLI